MGIFFHMLTDCYHPSAPDNGEVELLLEGITTYPGAAATQSCNEGYVLTGNKTIVCQANGLWTSSISCMKNGLYTTVASLLFRFRIS